MKIYNVIGIMSGTSLDGIDLAYCRFYKQKNDWQYEIKDAITVDYSDEWKNLLQNINNASAQEFVEAHFELGRYFGINARNFIQKNKLKIDFIASHGHTVFHQTHKNLTFQIGEGSSIAMMTGKMTICDFRTMDVAHGGQGAPLVPIGDKLLFSDYNFSLNLGGFSNISFDENNKRIAFDICPVNIIFNNIASGFNKKHDDDGLIARSGELNLALFDELNNIEYYKNKQHKSLSAEWVNEVFLPIVKKYNISANDKMRTISEHVAWQIHRATKKHSPNKILVTGGGVFNKFLMERIQHFTKHEIVIPSENLINFKEALIFAFLGVLRQREEVNCLKSVTGAATDNIGGAIYIPR